jgi:FkbM family methyltransferase
MTDAKPVTEHHPIFAAFARQTAVTSGAHVYDFLGGSTRVGYRRGWEKNALAAGKTQQPGYPPKNEHYLDWIGVLTAVNRARGTFRMAELGAGWGPWLVRGALAARQRPGIDRVELVAVEADATHYGWLREHFAENGLDPAAHHLLHGAVSDRGGELTFPVIENPDEDYGSGLSTAARAARTVTVRAYTLQDVLARFSGPLDFLHVDIQGAEYDALPAAMDRMTAQVRSLMVGTHTSAALHDGLVAQLKAAGWREVMNLARNTLHPTPWGAIKVDDGFLLFDNPGLL